MTVRAMLSTASLILFSGAEGNEYLARRDHIETMTQAERNGLERNFERFQSLDEQQQGHLRDLHAAVQEDARLQQTLDAYLAWLKTLDPWQREELRNEGNQDKRLLLVRKFKEQQAQAPWRDAYSGGFGSGGFFGRGFAGVPRLSDGDLAAVMQTIEQSLPPRPDFRKRLNGLTGLERNATLMDMATQPAPFAGKGESARWPDSALFEKLLNSISDEELRQKILAVPERDGQRRFLASVIVRGLFAEWSAQLEKRRPTEEQIQEFFMQLDGKDRDEIMKLPPQDAKRRLTMMYQHRHPEQMPRGSMEMWRLMQRIFSRSDGRTPGFERPPGDNKGRFPFGRKDGETPASPFSKKRSEAEQK